MAQESFEIYAFKDGNWSVDSAHGKKNLAISLALTLLNKTDHTAVRVIKKYESNPINKAAGVVIFKESSEDISISDKAWIDNIHKNKENRIKKTSEGIIEQKKVISNYAETRAKNFISSIFTIIIIVIIAIGVLFGGRYYLLDYLETI